MTRTQLLALSIDASTCLALPTAAFAEGRTDQARKAIAPARKRVVRKTTYRHTHRHPTRHTVHTTATVTTR